MAEHYIIKCTECTAIIAQCRCISPDKKIEYRQCDECKAGDERERRYWENVE